MNAVEGDIAWRGKYGGHKINAGGRGQVDLPGGLISVATAMALKRG